MVRINWRPLSWLRPRPGPPRPRLIHSSGSAAVALPTEPPRPRPRPAHVQLPPLHPPHRVFVRIKWKAFEEACWKDRTQRNGSCCDNQGTCRPAGKAITQGHVLTHGAAGTPGGDAHSQGPAEKLPGRLVNRTLSTARKANLAQGRSPGSRPDSASPSWEPGGCHLL